MNDIFANIENLDLQKIKASRQEHEIRLNELRGLLIGCARKIKVFMVIAAYKQKMGLSQLRGH
ncbi:hypothetical protein B6N58_01710 [Legionella micdadei]|nr:hypothetical protein B6N58_01710 [Legionella micdadei]